MNLQRVVQVAGKIKASGLSASVAFGPMRRDGTRPYVGGGEVSFEEYQAILNMLNSQPEDAARNRALRAGAAH